MTDVKTLEAWLSTLPEDMAIAIDRGGLTLIAKDGESYFKVGGTPEDDAPWLLDKS